VRQRSTEINTPTLKSKLDKALAIVHSFCETKDNVPGSVGTVRVTIHGLTVHSTATRCRYARQSVGQQLTFVSPTGDGSYVDRDFTEILLLSKK